jgi:chromosome segregation ATPase
MEFRDYAAKETATLFSRLLASQAEASLKHLQALREALDAASHRIEDDATGATQADQDIQELIRRLNTAAGAAARAASQKIQKELQTLLDAANGDLASARSENARLSASIADAQADAESVRADLKNQSERAEALDRDLDAAIEAHAHVDAARLEAENECRKLTAAHAALENDLADARSLLDATVAEAARVSGELESARREQDELNERLNETRASAERAQDEVRSGLESAQAELRAEREQGERLNASLAEAETHIAVLRADVAEAQAQAEVLRTELQKETDRAEAADRDLDSAIEAHALVDAQRIEAEADARKHAQARAAAEKDLAEVRSLLDAAVAQSARLGMQLDANVAENRTLAADLSAAQAELDAARTQREAISAQLEASRARVQTLERNQMAHEGHVRQLEGRLHDALQAEAGARALAASTDVENTQSHVETSALRSETDRLASLLENSARAVDELSSASTIADLLAALVKNLAAEFSRVALFRVKANRLEGEHQVGFDLTTDVTKLVIPYSVDSLLTRAASSGNIEHVTGVELADSNRAPFGGNPTAAIALPIVFQGETFATVYADSDLPLSERTLAGQKASARFATLLVRTTAMLLTRLSQELKTLNELRDYAAMLLQEAEEMYTADIQAEKSEEERRARLKDTIECARQLYAQRATLESPAAASLLDERIAAAIEGEPATPFARDLRTIAGGAERKKKSRRSAAS